MVRGSASRGCQGAGGGPVSGEEGRPELAPEPPAPPISFHMSPSSCPLGLGLGRHIYCGGHNSQAGSSGPEEAQLCPAGMVAHLWPAPSLLGTPLPRALSPRRLCCPACSSPWHTGFCRAEHPPPTAPHQEPQGLSAPPHTQLSAHGPPGSSAAEPGSIGPQHLQLGLGHRAQGSARPAHAPASRQHLLPGMAPEAHPAGEDRQSQHNSAAPQPSERGQPQGGIQEGSDLTLVGGASSRALSSPWLIMLGLSEGELGLGEHWICDSGVGHLGVNPWAAPQSSTALLLH